MKILIDLRASPRWLRSISCRNLSCNIASCRAPESAKTCTTRIGGFFWSDWRNCGGIIRIGLNESNGLLTYKRVNKAETFCAQANGSRRENRSEEHTSELQSLRHLVCRLLLEKK